MTKKEELLAFVNANVSVTHTLKFYSTIQQTNESCLMIVGASQTRIAQIITENFDDNLVGNMPNDNVIHEIHSWEICER